MNTQKSGSMHIHYDREGDMLEIRVGEPTASYMEEIGDDMLKRIDEKTGKVLGITILNFTKRAEKQKTLDFTLPREMHISA